MDVERWVADRFQSNEIEVDNSGGQVESFSKCLLRDASREGSFVLNVSDTSIQTHLGSPSKALLGFDRLRDAYCKLLLLLW